MRTFKTLGLVFLMGAVRLLAFAPVPLTQWVSFSGNLSLSGGGGGGAVIVYGEGSTVGSNMTMNGGESPVCYVPLKPGKQYTVSVIGALIGRYVGNNTFVFSGGYTLSFTAPDGYAIYLNGAQNTQCSRTYNTQQNTNQITLNDTYTIDIYPIADSSSAPAGSFSGFELGKAVTWQVGLGSQRSGQSAGRITFSQNDLTYNTPATSVASRYLLFNILAQNNGQITTVMDGAANQRLWQVMTPQTFVNLVDDSQGNGYTMNFYQPSEATLNTGVNPNYYTLNPNVTAWKTIHVTSPGANQLVVTETEGATPESRTVRVSSLTLDSGTVASGTYQWTLQEGDGTTTVRTTTHVSTNNGGTRNDVVTVHTGDSNGITVSETKFCYATQPWGGEEVSQVIADPNGAALTTTYTYFTSTAAPGNYGRVQSVTDPTGNWRSYLYYDDWNRRGQVQIETRPFVGTPATWQAAATNIGRSVSYDYAQDDYSGRWTIPTSQLQYTNGVLTGKQLTTPTGWQSRNSMIFTSYQTNDYSSAAASQQSIREVTDPINSNYNNLVLSVKRPDQSQDSYAYYLGTFTPTPPNTAPNTLTSPTFYVANVGTLYFRTNVWHGTANSSGADSFSGWAGATVATIYLVSNKSTMDVTIQDPAGNVVHRETWVFTGVDPGTHIAQFSQLSSSDLTYDPAGRLLTTVTNNGSVVTNTYTGGRLSSTVDPTGIETDFTYDKLGRVSTSTKKGAPLAGTYAAQADITTTYTYDGANHVTQTQICTGNPPVPMLTNTAIYDKVGRQTQQVQYSGSSNSLTTVYDYSVGNGSTATVNLPGGATKITTNNLDGQLSSITGTGVINEFFSYSVDSGTGNCSVQHRLGSTASPAVATTTNDWLGRKISFVQPALNGTTATTSTQSWLYNSSGQLWKSSQTGFANTLYIYDSMGRLYRQGLDVDGNDALDNASDDRITESNVSFVNPDGHWWRQTTTRTYATSSNPCGTTTNEQLTGFADGVLGETDVFDLYNNKTSASTMVARTNKLVTTTTVAPNSSTSAVQVAYNGLLMSAKDTAGFTMTYGYDGLGRPTSSTDPRTGATSTAYVAGTSLVYSITDPAHQSQATYTYDSAGRVATVTDAFNKVSRYDYTLLGQKLHEWGDTTYPVEHVYDAYGRQMKLKTYASSTASFTGNAWPTSPGTPAFTFWNYDEATGLLLGKYDAANLDSGGTPITNAQKVSFTYTQTGQVQSRTAQRGIVTTYGYSSATGEPTGITYSDGTPPVTYSHNRLGQVNQVIDGTGTRNLNYNLSGTLELQSEAFQAYYGNRLVTYTYDASNVKGRVTGFELGNSNNLTADQNVAYGYQADGRLQTLTANGQAFTIGYETNSHLVNQIQGPGGYQDLATFDSSHDWVHKRTTSISGVSKAAFEYHPDNMGRITQVTKTGELFNVYGNGTEGLNTNYGYDDRSQLKGEQTTVGNSSTVLPGRDNGTASTPGFTYDNLGNRTSTTHNSQTASYTPNALNQYQNRAVPGWFDVAGAANSSATVLTNGVGPARSGSYFFQNFQVNNSSLAQLINSLVSTAPPAKSLNNLVSFNWQNQPISPMTVAGPTGQQVSVLEFDGSPWHVGIEGWQHQYPFVNGRTYTFSFWARTPSGTRSITAMMTDNNYNEGITSATYTINTDWKLITVTKTYTNVSVSARLFYNWDGGGVPFQVSGAQITDITDALSGTILPSFVAQTQEQFGYDADGNLTSDGRWNYAYDAENRLIAMETNTAAANAGVTRQRLTFAYDYASRRVSKKVESGWNGSAYTSVDLWHRFLYNGTTLIAETDHNNGEVIVKKYFWGLDLSGTTGGAGGVGGLLMVQDSGNNYLPMYDALGSVHGLITGAQVTLSGTVYPAGSIVAAYEYDAFGQTLRETGPYAASNPIGYSTRYTDLETGLVYYGRRFYSPALGRFINRDPIEEAGGINLYAFCGNNGVNHFDYLGMDPDQTVDHIAYDKPPYYSRSTDTPGWVGPLQEELKGEFDYSSFSAYLMDRGMYGGFFNLGDTEWMGGYWNPDGSFAGYSKPGDPPSTVISRALGYSYHAQKDSGTTNTVVVENTKTGQTLIIVITTTNPDDAAAAATIAEAAAKNAVAALPGPNSRGTNVTFGPFSFYDEASGSWKPLNSTNWANSGIDAGASEPSSRTAGETGGGLPALTAENYWAAYANQDSWAQRSPAALANAVYGNLAAQAEMYRNGADLFDYGVMVSIAAPPLVVAGAPAFLATAKGIAWFNSLPPTMKIWMASTAIRLATFGDLKGPALRPDGRSAGLQIVIEMVDTVKKKGAGTPPTK